MVGFGLPRNDVTKLSSPGKKGFSLGIDFHIWITLIFRGWVVIAGGATALLLPLWYSSVEQGYYFTFASMLALQIFFELGFNQIIVQLVSHEAAHLTEEHDGGLTGNVINLDRLTSLVRMVSRWYAVAALLFALIGGGVGSIFFMQRTAESVEGWLGIWAVMVGCTAINLWLSPRLAAMEGFGKVGQVARMRLVQSVLGYLAFWGALLSGAGLWASVALPAVSAACTAYWITNYGHTLRWVAQRSFAPHNQMKWRVDVLPLQWRIALSWISGYLIFNLFTPMVFSRYGAAEAGRLGMALTLFSALSTIGMSWVNAKAPTFTMQIARGERGELNVQFRRLFIQSATFISAASVGVLVFALYFRHIDLPLMARIASPAVLAVLAIATIVNSMVYSMAIYMRAHREEPMLVQSIVVGLLVVISVYVGSIYGVLTMMVLYMSVSLFVSLPWTIRLFLSYYRRVRG